jgi:anti-sigma factor RsiW
MKHEDAYILMMDALDGELADSHKDDLEAHLRACPACDREWQVLLAIDMLFRHTPALAPAAGFTQRTLARLPNRQYRVWTISTIYVLLLLGGALPMLVGLWVYNQFGTALSEPSLWRTLSQAVGQTLQVVGTVLGALVAGAGEFVVQQPAVLGWLLVIVGLVSLWSGVFQQLVLRPTIGQPSRVTN